jgi:hypothetical protein
MNSQIWGPHYWFFLHTISYNYPQNANDVTKKKYYDLIMNFPLFIPDETMAKNFNDLLDKYPVSPYLNTAKNFQKWVHFIHNKINIKLGKKQISQKQARIEYMLQYESATTKAMKKMNLKKHYIYLVYIVILVIFLYFLMKQ